MGKASDLFRKFTKKNDDEIFGVVRKKWMSFYVKESIYSSIKRKNKLIKIKVANEKN